MHAGIRSRTNERQHMQILRTPRKPLLISNNKSRARTVEWHITNLWICQLVCCARNNVQQNAFCFVMLSSILCMLFYFTWSSDKEKTHECQNGHPPSTANVSVARIFDTECLMCESRSRQPCTSSTSSKAHRICKCIHMHTMHSMHQQAFA